MKQLIGKKMLITGSRQIEVTATVRE